MKNNHGKNICIFFDISATEKKKISVHLEQSPRVLCTLSSGFFMINQDFYLSFMLGIIM